MQSLSGGVFPFPQSVTDLVKRLPPPNTFEVKIRYVKFSNLKAKLKASQNKKKGPFVIIDELIRVFQQAELVEGTFLIFVI